MQPKLCIVTATPDPTLTLSCADMTCLSTHGTSNNPSLAYLLTIAAELLHAPITWHPAFITSANTARHLSMQPRVVSHSSRPSRSNNSRRIYAILCGPCCVIALRSTCWVHHQLLPLATLFARSKSESSGKANENRQAGVFLSSGIFAAHDCRSHCLNKHLSPESRKCLGYTIHLRHVITCLLATQRTQAAR